MPDRMMTSRVRSNRRRAGRATGSLVFLLLLLVGAGGWNYHRNWEIEKQTDGVRPYKSYEVEDLEALKAAYTSELGGVQSQFEQAKRRRVRPTRERIKDKDCRREQRRESRRKGHYGWLRIMAPAL